MWARLHCPGPHKQLPASVRRVLARASEPLRVFLGPGDKLWSLLDGPLPQLGKLDQILPWGQTADLPAGDTAPQPDADSWQERLWQLPTNHEAAAACNDRRFAFRLGRDNDLLLPDTQVVDSLEALDAHIASARLGPDSTWVAKAPFSASGRERMRRRGRILDGEARVRTERLLNRYGELIVEPWMQRTADLACAGVIAEDLEDLQLFAPHLLRCDNTGVFRGIRIDDAGTCASLGAQHSGQLHETTRLVAKALFERGYRGAFCVDSFIYQDKSDQRLHSLCEINARMSFGIVARAHAEKLQQAVYDFSL